MTHIGESQTLRRTEPNVCFQQDRTFAPTAMMGWK
jgi:hypothetical protein